MLQDRVEDHILKITTTITIAAAAATTTTTTSNLLKKLDLIAQNIAPIIACFFLILCGKGNESEPFDVSMSVTHSTSFEQTT
jgi:hypothetical protein